MFGIDDELIRLLQSIEDVVDDETITYTAYRQGSIPQDQTYPDTFFTFWLNNELEHSSYDNGTSNVTYDFDVYVYSTDIERCLNLLDRARKKLKENGWIIIVRSFDAFSDEITHVGTGMQVCYLKQE